MKWELRYLYLKVPITVPWWWQDVIVTKLTTLWWSIDEPSCGYEALIFEVEWMRWSRHYFLVQLVLISVLNIYCKSLGISFSKGLGFWIRVAIESLIIRKEKVLIIGYEVIVRTCGIILKDYLSRLSYLNPYILKAILMSSRSETIFFWHPTQQL